MDSHFWHGGGFRVQGDFLSLRESLISLLCENVQLAALRTRMPQVLKSENK
jgi:hypothetical protein